MSSLVFFGAGASKPFGIPTMQEMVSEFEQNLEKKDLKLFKFYTEIKNILKQNPLIKVDIESMLSVIEGIAKNKTVDETEHFVFYSAKKIPNNSDFMMFPSDEIKIAEEIKQELHKYIKNTCKLDSDMTKIYKKTYAQFFKHIPGEKGSFNEYGELTIKWRSYTTNYDNIFETFWKKFCFIQDYFQRDGESDLYIFNSNLLEPKRTFCKLHGSLDWDKDPKSGRVTRKTPSNFNIHDIGDDVMLFPIQQKDLYLEPWFTMLTDLKDGLSEEKYWFVIGYAFNDIFIRNVFEEAMINKPDKKLVIIDPNAYEIKNKFDKSIQNKIDVLPIKFDDDCFGTKISDYTHDTKTIILIVNAGQNNTENKLFKFAVASSKPFESKNITRDHEPCEIDSKFKYVHDNEDYPGRVYEFDRKNLSGIRLELKINCRHDDDITLYVSDDTKNINFSILYCNVLIFSSDRIKEKIFKKTIPNGMTWLKNPITIDKPRLFHNGKVPDRLDL